MSKEPSIVVMTWKLVSCQSAVSCSKIVSKRLANHIVSDMLVGIVVFFTWTAMVEVDYQYLSGRHSTSHNESTSNRYSSDHWLLNSSRDEHKQHKLDIAQHFHSIVLQRHTLRSGKSDFILEPKVERRWSSALRSPLGHPTTTIHFPNEALS